MLTIALSKGRIFQETLPLLQGAGIECKENPETSRKLILNTNNENIRLLIVRASDVPTYVECGGADIGIAGKDVLDEFDSANLYQIKSALLSPLVGIIIKSALAIAFSACRVM